MPDNEVFIAGDHQDPTHALTLLLRGLPVGRAVQVGGETLVKSVPVKHGGLQTYRRWAVMKSTGVGAGSRAVPRDHNNTHKTAESAATAALKGGR